MTIDPRYKQQPVAVVSHRDFLCSDRHRRLYPDPFVYIPDGKMLAFLALLREGRDAEHIRIWGGETA